VARNPVSVDMYVQTNEENFPVKKRVNREVFIYLRY
jgi:hypothetical protein